MSHAGRSRAPGRSGSQAVEELVSHRYFQLYVTPVQVFNRATDPFLPAVRPHTFGVFENLDTRGLRNHVFIITRHQMKPGDIDRLNAPHTAAWQGRHRMEGDGSR